MFLSHHHQHHHKNRFPPTFAAHAHGSLAVDYRLSDSECLSTPRTVITDEAGWLQPFMERSNDAQYRRACRPQSKCDAPYVAITDCHSTPRITWQRRTDPTCATGRAEWRYAITNYDMITYAATLSCTVTHHGNSTRCTSWWTELYANRLRGLLGRGLEPRFTEVRLQSQLPWFGL